MNIVEVENITKYFKIYTRGRRLLELLMMGRLCFHNKFYALSGVSFDVRKGSVFGIIGPNGAGKTTLLRLIAGISQPSTGRIFVGGNVSTLIDLSAGFHEDFTGRENISLNCSILGMTRKQIHKKIEEIIDFAEIGDFIDRPVRTYSMGMRLRLGFSIAISFDSDILLVDEVLAVGDQYFQRKCIERIKRFVAKGGTILFVSHDLYTVRNICHRVLWLRQGRVEALGDPEDVFNRYIDYIRKLEGRMKGGFCVERGEGEVEQEVAMEHAGHSLRTRTGEVEIKRVRILDSNGKEKDRFSTHESMTVEVDFRTLKPLDSPVFGVAIFRNDGVYCYGPNTLFDNCLRGVYDGEYTLSISYPSIPLLSGKYNISIAIYDKEHVMPYEYHNQLYSFSIETDIKDHGLCHIDHRWNIVKRG